MENKAVIKRGNELTKPSALNAMAMRVNVEPNKLLDTLKATVFKNASNEELMALVVVSNEYGLNPFLKEIYAFPAKGGGIVPVIGVDGWLKMVNRQPDLDGLEFEFQDDEEGKPYSCTAIIHVKQRSHPIKVTEYFSECARKSEPWEKMPRRMLRHKALMQAARVAFGFSGVTDEDEALDIKATVIENTPERPRKAISAVALPSEPIEAEPETAELKPEASNE